MKTFLSVLGWALGYYVATLACVFLGALHPFLWVYGSLTCVVLAAWPYCRLVNRYPYMGMALLVTVLSIGINLALGEGDLLYVCLALGIALVARAHHCAPRSNCSGTCNNDPHLREQDDRC